MLNRPLKAARKADDPLWQGNYFRTNAKSIEDRSRLPRSSFVSCSAPASAAGNTLSAVDPFFDIPDEPLLKMRTDARSFLVQDRRGSREPCSLKRNVMVRPVGGYRTDHAGLTSITLESKGERPVVEDPSNGTRNRPQGYGLAAQR
jgi:hypothetical protein